MKTILSIIGARPQFIKHAPMQLELQKYFNALTIHTGQHYDENMSNVFFNELRMNAPDFLFDLGGGKPQGEQTALMMIEIEKVVSNVKPDAILIYGDTNSTLAGAIVGAKMNIPIIHIEAGLRSFNRSMPEEVNRIVADQLSSILFCPTPIAIKNLSKEGINHERVFLCGDVMGDTLKLVQSSIIKKIDYPYYFVTLHRPYNVDDRIRMQRILTTLNSVEHKVIFPIHPRTISMLDSFGLKPSDYTNINFINPVGYIESISYQKYSECIITDSGGIQKEAYMQKKKCITLRSETEWVETLENGWNTLVFEDIENITSVIHQNPGEYISGIYGNGNASQEIVSFINQQLSN